MENLAFHSLFRWKVIILQILTSSLVHFSLKGRENVTFWSWEWKGYSTAFQTFEIFLLLTQLYLKCHWSEIQQQLITPNVVFSIFHWTFEAKFMLMKYWELLVWSGWSGPPRGTKTKIWASMHGSGCTHCDVTWCERLWVSPCFFFSDVLTFRAFSSLSSFHCLKCPISIRRWLHRTVRAAGIVRIAKPISTVELCVGRSVQP